MNQEASTPKEPSNRFSELESDLASLRALGVPESEIESFLLERMSIDHPINADTLHPGIVRTVNEVVKNTNPN